jgi:DNA repair protein RadC
MQHKSGEEKAMVVLRNSTIEIRDSRDIAQVFRDLLSLEDKIDQDKEHFYVMHVNPRQRINLVELMAIGTLNHAEIHPWETYRRAVIEGSYSIVVAHNHPTGDVMPSAADIRTTTQLIKAGKILNIPMLDHIIFTVQGGTFFSFRDNKTEHYPILTKPTQTHAERYGMKKPIRKGGEANHGISQ